MRNSSWQITSIKEGNAVATVKGVSNDHALAAIEEAMYGRDPLAAAAAAKGQAAAAAKTAAEVAA